jgi:uncharacterized protein (DUF302 family)
VFLASAWRHVLLIRALTQGEALTIRPSTLAIALASVLAAVGLLMVLYLLYARGAAWSSTQKGHIMPTQNDSGMIMLPGTRSVDETVAKLKSLLEQRKITLFALIDHNGEAAKVGMKMPPTKLLIFGNPKGGTPVMLAAPSSAIDLPLKLLVWEGADGETCVSYNDPKYLEDRHHSPVELVQNWASPVFWRRRPRRRIETMPDDFNESSRARPVRLGTASLIARQAAVFLLLASVTGLFAYLGGWLTSRALTPARMIDTFEQVNGPHPGFRRNHAKGVCFSGYFDSNGQGVALSKASIFAPRPGAGDRPVCIGGGTAASGGRAAHGAQHGDTFKTAER